jgi:hypothetical protein
VDRDLLEPTDGILKITRNHAIDEIRQIKILNDRLMSLQKLDEEGLENQFPHLSASSFPDAFGNPLRYLTFLQRGIDASATIHRRELFGASPIGKFNFNPGILFWITFIAPVSVFMFEMYAHLDLGALPLSVYIALMILSIFLERDAFARRRIQDHFQDYRCLAEALRVQLFWAVAGLPVAVSDNYIRKQTLDLGWIHFALRGPSVLAAAVAIGATKPDRRIVLPSWIMGQIKFYVGSDAKSGRAMGNLRAAIATQRWGKIFLTLGVITATALLGVHFMEAFALHTGTWVDAVLDWAYNRHRYLDVVAVTTPAIAAFFTALADIRSFWAHASTYRQMGQIFRQAQKVASTIPAQGTSGYVPTDDIAFKELIHDLGREALSENVEWLIGRRGRHTEPSL